jgi:hypothetical protein
MYRKFYRVLRIGNLLTTILLFPAGSDGVLGYWGVGKNDFAWMHGCMEIMQSCSHAIMQFPHFPNLPNPTFQYSNIPSFPL